MTYMFILKCALKLVPKNILQGYVFDAHLSRENSLLGIHYRSQKMFQGHCIHAESRQVSRVEATYP